MNGPNEELPEPKIGKIRNFSDLPEQTKATIRDGVFLSLEGQGVHDNAIGVGMLSGLLEHFEKLFRIMQAVGSNVEVHRRGRLADIPGGRHLEALPAFAGSYALPIRLEAPDGELIGTEYHELEALMEILAPDAELDERLPQLPERVGDELHELLNVLAVGDMDLKIEPIRGGAATDEVRISADDARRKAAWLSESAPYDLGVGTLRGKLFRIDTKKAEIRVDVLQDGESAVEKATYRGTHLEALRAALDNQVDIEVEISEERRPYERTARTRNLSVVTVRQTDEDVDEEPPPVGA